jgi:hypothetical protein
MMLHGGADHVIFLGQLPPLLQLYSIQLSGLCLSSAALQDAARVTFLKQLRLSDCKLQDTDAQALAAALPQLPAGLEHLSISKIIISDCQEVQIPPSVLTQLQQLTYLERTHAWLSGDAEAGPALQHLQPLTRLADLRLVAVGAKDDRIPASMLSGAQHLTRLELVASGHVEPGVLAGKTQLQHLHLDSCSIEIPDLLWDDSEERF